MGAAQLGAEQKDDLLAGHTPRSKCDGLTVAELVNRFVTAKKSLVETGELKQRTWQDRYVVCERIVKVFGRNRLVSDLEEVDFAQLRSSFGNTRGPFALAGDVTRARVLFKWGVDERLVLTPVRYGQSFKKPSRKTLRLAKANNGPRMFDRREVWAMFFGAVTDGKQVWGASQPLRTTILLALNGGLENSDVAKLPLSALDLKRAWRCTDRRVEVGFGHLQIVLRRDPFTVVQPRANHIKSHAVGTAQPTPSACCGEGSETAVATALVLCHKGILGLAI